MELKIYLFDSTNISSDELLNSPYISDVEKASFEKYKIEEVKKEKIISTIFKNKYIGEYYLNERGKPICDKCCFNISHSYGVVVFIMDEVPIGIDIEKIRKVDNKLKDFITNEQEKRYINNDEKFFEIWTNKESLLKAHGCGITGLPIKGERVYENKIYINKTIRYKDYVITVSRQSNEDYSLKIVDSSDSYNEELIEK